MPERLGQVPVSPIYGSDIPLMLPGRAIIVGMSQIAPPADGLALIYRYQTEPPALPRYEPRAIRTFGANETIPDDYFPVMSPLCVDQHGMAWYVTYRERT